MRATRLVASAILVAQCALATLGAAYGQLVLGVSVNEAPPPLPVYDQPPIPAPGYLWVPGYWAWSENGGYYWVPGTWILPPRAGLVWTPGYWGSEEGVYVFHVGYWGSHIGFYGGVDYGFGYDGIGYEGGFWKNGRFFYNSAVNKLTVSVTNVYSKPVAIERRSNASFSGGKGGTTAKATSAQLAAEWENHIAATPEQRRHAEAASKDPALSLSRNHGYPVVAATAHAGLFKGPEVVAAHTDKPTEALNAPAGSKATPVQGNVADYRLPSSQGNAAAATTSTGLNQHKWSPGAKPLERQNVKLIANAPQHALSPPLPAAPPQTGKLVGQALRPALPPSAIKPRPPTKPKCSPGQQHC